MERLHTRGFHFQEGDHRWVPRGVTYGPFRPNCGGLPFPAPDRQRQDFEAMAAVGANAVRIYDVPDEALADRAAACGLRLLIDIPWPKHLDVYSDESLRRLCLGMVEDGVRRVSAWPNVLGVLVGNEIPPDLVRWASAARVEAFLRRLFDAAKSLAPDLAVGYANYPSTEYLSLGFLDFLGFNIFLHDSEVFRSYLVRLRHLCPELPLVLTEVGLDSQGHGDEAQAAFLAETLTVAYEAGMAGAFVFSWTDEWHAGGFEMERWAFGLVDRRRRPKLSLAAVAEVFAHAPRCRRLEPWPRVAVVVATHNGARTLRACIESLQRLTYPDFEIVVVDDGSTDETPQVLQAFDGLRVITQENQGLSAARNAGIAAASGEIVAFTDSDCVVDPDWLHHLIVTLEDGGWAGVGGPNLTPSEDGREARSVGLAPGHATHVLMDSGEAEHVPGCNMAFRCGALEEVGGFDPVFREAGDDVDVMWRLQELGHRIGFSPAAFVWHHRRSTVRDYWRQQMGYGEAEAILLRKHPHRFNDQGHSMWRGTIYAQHGGEALLRRSVIHHGVFGSAGYQCIYERPGWTPTHLLTSLEWWLFCLAALLLGFTSTAALRLGVVGIALSLGVSSVLAHRRWAAAKDRSLGQLPLVWLLWITQPLARGGARHLGRLRQGPQAWRPWPAPPRNGRSWGAVTRAGYVLAHWSEAGAERVEVVGRLSEILAARGWLISPGSEWEPWDLSVALSPWFKTRLTSAQEDHGERRRLLRLRFRLVPTTLLSLLSVGVFILSLVVATQDTVLARVLLIGGLSVGWVLYRQAWRRRGALMAVVGNLVQSAGYEPLRTEAGATAASPQSEVGSESGPPVSEQRETA